MESPVRSRSGRSKISNLPWVIDSRELAAQLKLRTVGLINDLEAFAYGIDALESKDFVTISEGSSDAEGNMAVVSAGSGLGEAGLYWDGFRHHPFACEGGHTEFAPKNDVEVELLQYLMKKYGQPARELRKNPLRSRRQEHLRIPQGHRQRRRAVRG